MKTWKHKYEKACLELCKVTREKERLNEDLENYIHELHKEIVELKGGITVPLPIETVPKRQTMKLRYPVIVAISLGVGILIGIRGEATRIQQTCEADVGATMLNGTAYLCLSQRHIEYLQGQQKGPNT